MTVRVVKGKLGVTVLCASALQAAPPPNVGDLCCEYPQDPIGIAMPAP